MVRILFVDDEPHILKALRRSFADDDFEVYLAESGEAALLLLAEQPVDIVVSDIRMPGMDGHQLLLRVKKEYPGIIRLALSGSSEKNEVYKVLLNGLAKIYLIKPWTDEPVKATIHRLVNTRAALRRKEATAILSDLEWLPTANDIYSKLLVLIEKDANAKAMADLIEQDPAMAVKIIKVVNSAYFGLITGCVRDAVVYLGLTVIKEIVLAARFYDLLSCQDRLGARILWHHAVVVNKLVAQMYEKLLNKKLDANLSSAGLLCDVGILVLMGKSFCYSKKLMAMLKSDGELLLAQLEVEEFQIGHQEIGASLLEWWEVPYPIIEAALYHHNPSDPNVINTEIVGIVHLADYYAWQFLGKETEAGLDRQVFERLPFSEEECEAFLKTMGKQLLAFRPTLFD